MKVIDVIASALRLIGRSELIPFIEDASNAYEEDAGEVIETLLYCFNAVEDELARKYVPLVICEEMSSPDNKYYFSKFKCNPIKIKKVTADGKTVPFKIFVGYMQAQANKIEVEYEFAPMPKPIDGFSDFLDEVGEYLIALGMASEYSIINGEAEMADRWEKKYRAQLDAVQRKLPVCAGIPPRRWV